MSKLFGFHVLRTPPRVDERLQAEDALFRRGPSNCIELEVRG